MNHAAFVAHLERVEGTIPEADFDLLDAYLHGASADYPLPSPREVEQAKRWRSSPGEIAIMPVINDPDATFCETFLAWHFSISIEHIEWLTSEGVFHPIVDPRSGYSEFPCGAFADDFRKLRGRVPYPNSAALIAKAHKASKRGICSIRDASVLCNVSEKTVDRSLADGTLDALRFPGGEVRIDRIKLDAWNRRRLLKNKRGRRPARA